ncbi:bacterial regulatory s, tetR family protein [Mycobacterium ulcerans str. Harvey]|uniref:Bacterial regulatory s, tetR family protein n=1 Tax=Mycobacterium ulcerans str. Harvey TaxID=1299332 RepID=A0ABN0QTV1_MYCUL|nr:bacterial regulatory s, tetR family protein [Mycobacterium ulcerans str. Harvey]
MSRKRLVGTYGSMTHPNNPGTRRQADLSSRLTRRRHKLAPDPGIRRAILVAASMSVREHGVRGLSVATVLDRAQLSTRAFYRHFESKDQLVAAMFLEVARVEAVRLRTLMAKATNPIEGVAAWIDGRLDLAFDDAVKADLRHLSMDAQSHLLNAPSWSNPHTPKRLSRSSSSFTSAWPRKCSTTSTRTARRAPFRAWCGPTRNSSGPPGIADATRFARARCDFACEDWALRRTPLRRSPRQTDM